MRKRNSVNVQNYPTGLLDNVVFIWDTKEDSSLPLFSLFEKQTRLEIVCFCCICLQLLWVVVARKN